MNVNFIKQFKLIMEYGKRNKLSSYERVLYVALFYCANQVAMAAENQDWPEEYFPVSNSDIKSWTGLDERMIRNLRNSLKQRGLIDFKKGDGKKCDPEYRFFYLQQIGCKIVPDSEQTENKNAPDMETDSKFVPDKAYISVNSAPDTVPDSVGDSVPDSVGDRVVIDDKSAPDSGLSSYSDKKIKEKEKRKITITGNGEYPITSYPIKGEDDAMRSDGDMISRTINHAIIADYEKRIKKNIGYEDLLISHPYDIRMIDGMVDLIVEQMLSRSEEVLVAGNKYPAEIVKKRLLQIEYSHIEYVLFCLKKNTTKVGNIKKYLLATLFNAPSTIEGYYSAEVNHDMYGAPE